MASFRNIPLIKKCMEEFIDIYHDLDCLWNVKSSDYHNREKREEAYDKLVEKLKTVEPNSSRDTVVKKINSLRTSYRKELNKHKASIHSGDEIVYQPKLWYFEKLSFLKDRDLTTNDSTCNDDKPDIVTRKRSLRCRGLSEDDFDDKPSYITVASPEVKETKSKRRKKRALESPEKLDLSTEEDEDIDVSIKDHSPVKRDELRIFAEMIEHRLRNIQNRRKVCILRHEIEKLLFEAEINEMDSGDVS